ncbi:MAG: PEP-CTERM sorting domain-containing protein, partial [Nitrospira sp.]
YGEPQAVPAPAAVLLLGSGLAVLVWARRKSLLPE